MMIHIRLSLMVMVVAAVVAETAPPQQCSKSCTKEYMPMCGNDGKTYDNPCILRLAACHDNSITLRHEGRCAAPPQQCSKSCTKEYMPMCGSDGKTYDNPCILRLAACHDSSITLRHEGRCVARTTRDACPSICPAIYRPQCGSDGKTYSNECTLRIAICKNRNLSLKHPGECRATSRPCPDACPFNYDPVCGSDDKTYGNDCQLSVASCNDPSITLKHRGECQATSRPCPESCPFNYDPVCGSDGKTYGNDCQLSVASCKDPSITLKHRGECQGPTTPPRQCPQICPLNFDPVCGSDGKTYSNNCQLGVASCNDPSITFKHKGQCQGYIPPPTNCGPGICPAVYQPVCGSNGKIYSNKCFFNVAKCKNPRLEQGSHCY